MKIFRRLIFKEVISAVAFVSLGFLALFFFFDLLDEMRSVGRAPGYTLSYALLAVALEIPNHLYELLPITVLIGTIFVMARFAQSSEFTIMRTSGMGPWRALGTMVVLGLGFVLFTGFLGDYAAPAAQRLALQAQAKYLGASKSAGSTGAWLKERSPEGQMLAVNVGAIDANGRLGPVRIFAFDTEGRMRQQLHARSGQVAANTGKWELNDVQRSQFDYASSGEALSVQREQLSNFTFHSSITGDMALAAAHKPDHMPMLELWRFAQHLKANEQSAQKYEMAFWRKVFYPLSCLVMVVLALPFAYLHFRSGGIAGYVFGGVMAGISFFLLNNVFGYAGSLQNWSPLWSAAAPGLAYSVLSLAAFGWLVLRR
ncbi:LPS export ABC transporter permease LptG [Comamonas nitrativorans]|uniref:LPS export ABC transporter permease LptG n=1 Tax=Comamonas nitrativorans TaxID=108437 RepID=A0ABV9GXL6_9BURK